MYCAIPKAIYVMHNLASHLLIGKTLTNKQKKDANRYLIRQQYEVQTLITLYMYSQT